MSNDILTFCQEKDNPHDPFAVAIKGKLKSTVAHITVGHVAIEISRFVFFSLERGCNYSAEVLTSGQETFQVPTPTGRTWKLKLSVEHAARVTWTNQGLLEKLKGFILMNYSNGIEACLKDDSAEILKSLKIDYELEIVNQKLWRYIQIVKIQF